MRFIHFPKRFQCSEEICNGEADWLHCLPFFEVFDVPFPFAGQVLELPTEIETVVDVSGEESLYMGA